MPKFVTSNSMCKCSFGASPCPLIILPTIKVMINSIPVATIMDHKPGVNLATFGLCRTPTNPAVAAATAAAMGVLTPVPCVPVLPAPWVPGQPAITLQNKILLNDKSKLTCAYGGLISLNSVSQKVCDC